MTDLSREQLLDRMSQVEHWYHAIELAPGVVTPGLRGEELLELLELPTDCRGLRVLDLGANDGFFSITLEKRGAKVVAVDYLPPERTGFPLVSEVFKSRVKRYTDNIYNVSKSTYGEFDIVLCLGLLYHLRDPLRALSRIRDVCKGELYVESFVIDSRLVRPNEPANALANGSEELIAETDPTGTSREDIPDELLAEPDVTGGDPAADSELLAQPRQTAMGLAAISEELLTIPLAQFFPRKELDDDPTNWWGYNTACLKQMLEATNFTVVFHKPYLADRAVYKCVINDDPDVKYWRTVERGTV
jgi:2-polyprenyl-3-methyl-5-hydroxy-6-metoxy-1,4-benzoquinol methylase